MHNVLGPVFGVPEIAAMRTARIERVETILDPSASPVAPSADDELALRYAIAHHRLEAAENVARRGDSDGFWHTRSIGHADLATLATHTPTGRAVIVNPPRGDFITSPASDTPFYLVSRSSPGAALDIISLASRALTAAAASGFGDLVGGNASVLCLMARRATTDTFYSWTTTRLPGTVYTDFSDHHELLARDIIHEAGHNWLNDAMTSLRIRLPADVTYYSPWRRTARPAFGFLHACWAFPLTMIYAAHVAASRGDASGLMESYLAAQRRQLAQTERDHIDALRLVTDSGLRDRLKLVYDHARAL